VRLKADGNLGQPSKASLAVNLPDQISFVGEGSGSLCQNARKADNKTRSNRKIRKPPILNGRLSLFLSVWDR